MGFLGLWHAPKTDAPYVCVEPWVSLPSHSAYVEDFAKQEHLISLNAGKPIGTRWSSPWNNHGRKSKSTPVPGYPERGCSFCFYRVRFFLVTTAAPRTVVRARTPTARPMVSPVLGLVVSSFFHLA